MNPPRTLFFLCIDPFTYIYLHDSQVATCCDDSSMIHEVCLASCTNFQEMSGRHARRCIGIFLADTHNMKFCIACASNENAEPLVPIPVPGPQSPRRPRSSPTTPSHVIMCHPSGVPAPCVASFTAVAPRGTLESSFRPRQSGHDCSSSITNKQDVSRKAKLGRRL